LRAASTYHDLGKRGWASMAFYALMKGAELGETVPAAKPGYAART
jgi:hypothetical protein